MNFEPVTNRYAIWFGRVVWLGIIANYCFVIPTLIMPQRVLAFLNLDPTNTPIWVQCAIYLLAQLSLFYIPAAIDPYRYRANAYLCIFSRLAGTAFFWIAVLCGGYRMGIYHALRHSRSGFCHTAGDPFLPGL